MSAGVTFDDAAIMAIRTRLVSEVTLCLMNRHGGKITQKDAAYWDGRLEGCKQILMIAGWDEDDIDTLIIEAELNGPYAD